MQSKLREVQGSEVSLPLFSGEKRVLEILADISERVPKDLSLHVSRLVIDKESVQVKGTTDAFNNVDVIKNKLAASPRYTEVKIVSAAADKKKGAIRFEIRLQLGEAS
jgi:general secretion pathway protein L